MSYNRRMIEIGAVFALLIAGCANAASDFDFMVGRWTGRESCKTGIYDVVFEARRCENAAGRYCEAAYTGTATTTARSPGSRGGTGAGTGQPTALPSDLAIEIRLAFGALVGTAHYSASGHNGRFGTTGVKMGGAVMPLPYGVKGTFTVTGKGRKLGFIADLATPEGPDHCGGNLSKQAPSAAR
jgi:hypothetical protein